MPKTNAKAMPERWTIQFRIPLDQKERFQAYLDEHGLSASTVARWWIRDLLAGRWTPEAVPRKSR